MSDRPLITTPPNDADKALHADIGALIKRHLTPDTPERVLAIASQVVGQVLAMQDQRTMTTDQAFQIITANIEKGNVAVVQGLLDAEGGTA
jgi:hypothetical protein